jgi:hypothetical protein
MNSSALPNGSHHAAPSWVRTDGPVVFNVEFDPSESLPIADLPDEVYKQLEMEKRAYEATLAPTAIDPRFGFEWALCCGVGCQAPCDKCQCTNVPLPQPKMLARHQ